MKYLVRAVKYLLYFVLFFAIIVLILFLLQGKKQGLAITDMFEEGSFPKLIGFFVLVAAIYPALGFKKRELHLNGHFSQYVKLVDDVMTNMGYIKESDSAEKVTYRIAKTSQKMSRMFEDRITFNITEETVMLEGYSKDLVRVIGNIEYRIREEENPENEE